MFFSNYEGGTDKLREMIENYEKEANRLYEHSVKLGEMINSERDVNVKKNLIKRKMVADSERYEILEDIRRMREYIG